MVLKLREARDLLLGHGQFRVQNADTLRLIRVLASLERRVILLIVYHLLISSYAGSYILQALHLDDVGVVLVDVRIAGLLVLVAANALLHPVNDAFGDLYLQSVL